MAAAPLVGQVWYFVAVSYDPVTSAATLYQEPVINRYNGLLSKIVPLDYRSHVSQALRARPVVAADIPFLIGGAIDENPARGAFVAQCYSGKIDRCGVHDSALSRADLDGLRAGGPPPLPGQLAYWDTSAGYTDHGIGDRVVDTGAARPACRGRQSPRARPNRLELERPQ